jgi:hypothetical protein
MLAAAIFLVEQIAIGLYIFIALGIFWQWRKLVYWRRDFRSSQFELGRDLARYKQANAMTALVLLVEAGLIVAGVQQVVAPTIRDIQDVAVVADQIIDPPFNTPTPPPAADVVFDSSGVVLGRDANPASEIRLTPTPTHTPVGTIRPGYPTPTGCDTPFASLQVPANGMVVHQIISVIGTAYTDADFSSYKLEISGPQTNGVFATMESFQQPVRETGRLSQFVPSIYLEGDYQFRLSVFDQTNTLKASCTVNIYISAPIPTETPIPLP